MKNVLATLTAYKAKKAEAEKLEKELENMKTEIMSYVLDKVERDAKGKATYICKPYTVTVTECTRTALDEKAIRELFPEIAKEHEKVTVYDRFSVK